MVTSKMENDVLAYLESSGDAFTHLYNSMFSDDIMTMEVRWRAMDLIMKRDVLAPENNRLSPQRSEDQTCGPLVV